MSSNKTECDNAATEITCADGKNHCAKTVLAGNGPTWYGKDCVSKEECPENGKRCEDMGSGMTFCMDCCEGDMCNDGEVQGTVRRHAKWQLCPRVMSSSPTLSRFSTAQEVRRAQMIPSLPALGFFGPGSDSRAVNNRKKKAHCSFRAKTRGNVCYTGYHYRLHLIIRCCCYSFSQIFLGQNHVVSRHNVIPVWAMIKVIVTRPTRRPVPKEKTAAPRAT